MSRSASLAKTDQSDFPSTTIASIFLFKIPPFLLIFSISKIRVSTRDLSLIAIVPVKE